MKLIITENRIEQIIQKSLSIVFSGFEDIQWSWADFNCGWGVCCDIYAVGFILPKDDYDDYLFKLVDGNNYDDDGDYPEELKGSLPEICWDEPNIQDERFDTILISEDMYDGLTDMFGDINHWRDSLLSLINKTFNTNARHLMYIYESDM